MFIPCPSGTTDMMLIKECMRLATLSVLLLVITGGASATGQTTPDVPPAGATTMLPHPADNAWWLSGQVNLISQTHGRFTSPYEGDNSLRPNREQALSRLWTIYTGVKLPGHTECLFDIELSLIHISEPTRLGMISYAVFCLK